MQDSLFIQAPAKINLALAVGPADREAAGGRHPVCTWMVAVDLCDDLTIQQLEPDRFSRYAILWHRDARRRRDIDWSIRNDLAVRAHLLLESTTGRRMPVQLKLEKRIPVGAGLGGGSSNAAAMLLGCNELFELGLSRDDLIDLAAQLGSDVPFFIRARSAIVEGFGERMTRIEADPDIHLVLLLPEFSCDTAAVYRTFDELATASAMTDEDLAARFAQGEAGIHAMAPTGQLTAEAPFNHLTLPARRHQPDLPRLMEEAAELTDLPVHMTGSGSALFAVCDNDVHAEFTARAVNERLADLVAIPVTRHPSRKSVTDQPAS